MGFLSELKRKLRFAIEQKTFNKAIPLPAINLNSQKQNNILWIIYDSCRYDTLIEAKTPVLDSYAKIYSAWSPATYTLPAHVSFFTGILPIVYEPLPYLNRFHKQLITMRKAGQAHKHAINSRTIELPVSENDAIQALQEHGYYTIGSAGATWFAKKQLRAGFKDFQYKNAQAFSEQAAFILSGINKNAKEKAFFAFMNLIETHSPYMHYGSDREEFSLDARTANRFPVDKSSNENTERAQKLKKAQIKAAEYLDTKLPELFSKLPKNTLVILTADHGECFGEDGLWGHGIYHEKVMNVPMACFSLDGKDPLLDT